jgi:hypothetical protein
LNQKITQRLNALAAKSQSERANAATFDEQLQRIALEKEQIALQMRKLTDDVAYLRKWIADHSPTTCDIDKVVVSGTPLHAQYVACMTAAAITSVDGATFVAGN